MKTLGISTLALALALPAAASAADVDIGEEIDVTAGQVTGLRCALEARESGDLTKIANCPLSEALRGIVVYDVANDMIVRFAKGAIPAYKLESAFGGGSIDFEEAVVKKVDKRTDIVVVSVEDSDSYSVTKKPKAGGFKGCL